MNKKLKILLGLISFCVLVCISSFSLRINWLRNNNRLYTKQITLLDGKSVEQNAQAESAKKSGSSDFDIDVSFDRSITWDADEGRQFGAQYDFIIENNEDCPIKDWQLTIEVPEKTRLDAWWNGEYSLRDDTLSIKPVDYNISIAPHAEIPVGFILYMTKGNTIVNCRLSAHKNVTLYSLPLFWFFIVLLFVVFVVGIVYGFFHIRYKQLRKKQNEYKQVIKQSFDTFANTIEAKDVYTQGHSRRVCTYACMIAKRMKLPDDVQEFVEYASLLHDIGKVGVPDVILNKPGRLTLSELDKMHMHAVIGGDILKDFTSVPGLADVVRHHHERYDGKGYPDGLAGNDIPLVARIICVADSYDAMTSSRCYRVKLSDTEVMSEITSCNGKQFDPSVVIHLLDMIREGVVPVTGNTAYNSDN